MASQFHRLRPAFVLTALLMTACTGALTDDGVAGPPGTEPIPGCTAEMTASQQSVGVYLETTCAHAGCHMPIGTQSPSFAAADLPELVTSGYSTQILARMMPSDPLRIMPPSRAANTPEEIAIVQRWLTAGSPTACASAAPAPLPEANSLDQGGLFTCGDPSMAAPGPQRVRRVGSPDWVHAAGGVLTLRELVANPWRATSGPYSTFTANESIDASSLLLYLDTLSSTHGLPGYAFQPWYRRGGVITALGYDIGCMNASSHSADVPMPACRDTFIDASFHLGSFARTPSDEERAELRGFLDQLLQGAMMELVMRRDALRTSSGNATADLPASDIAARRNQVLDEVYDASFVMFGGLHRPEGNAVGRLTTDEIGIALMNAVSTSLPNGLQADPNPRSELAWVSGFRTAQMAGTLDSDTHLHDYVQTFFAIGSGNTGGMSPSSLTYRADLQRDYTANSLEPLEARRGEYWLAPRIASFFREYFDYGGVAGVAKDDAGETSRWDFRATADGEDGRVSDAYGEIVAGTSDEPGMSDQLDDAIARAVVEAEMGHHDVFSALLTGRNYRVPGVPYSNARALPTGAACNPATCVERECCTGDEVCTVESIDAGGVHAYCTGTYLSSWFLWPRMYMDTPPIVENAASFASGPSTDARFTLLLADPAHASRWVTMPEATRAGVLTHPTWLAAHGGNADNDPSIVHRGRWIREHLFCETVAGLDLVQLDATLQPSDTLSARARIDAAMGPTGDERCANAACHGRMNTLGYPFEVYNHAGYLRATDHGSAPNGHSTITNWPGRGEVAIDDAVGLVTELAADPYARRCFLRHVFRYFMGRYETENDACTLTAMESAFAGGSLMDALTALYTSPTFLYRTESTVTP